MKFSFFWDGTDMLAEAARERKEVMNSARLYIALPILVFTGVFFLVGIFAVKRTSDQITRGIIHLYETLKEIADQKKEQKTSVLSFKKSALELNELHRTFNKIAKTMMLASSGMKENKEKAMLNYCEAYHIFKEFND